MKLTQRELLFKLAACKGIGNLGLLKVLDFSLRYNDATDFSKEEIVEIANIRTYYAAFSKSWDFWTSENEQLSDYKKKHKFITILDDDYPTLLKQIYNCPALLCYEGNINLLKTACLSIVGARHPSFYGKKVVQHYIPALIKEKYTIVSGLAKGIDRFSHQIAMENGGKTIGIIGNGLDVFYPNETMRLQKSMMLHQLVVTEYLNGTPPNKFHFPMRNRIIAGISKATCVIEARERSGSLITAQAALDYGREVFAVPGSVINKTSVGCHKLIQDGAKCTIKPEDILEEI